MSVSGLVSYHCEGDSHKSVSAHPYGEDPFLRREPVACRDIPSDININKGEGCGHELSVWPTILDEW